MYAYEQKESKVFYEGESQLFLLVVLSQTKYMYVRMVDGEEKQM